MASGSASQVGHPPCSASSSSSNEYPEHAEGSSKQTDRTRLFNTLIDHAMEDPAAQLYNYRTPERMHPYAMVRYRCCVPA